MGHYLTSFLVYHVGGTIGMDWRNAYFYPQGQTGYWVNYMGGWFVALLILPLLFCKLPRPLKLPLITLFIFNILNGLWEGLVPYVYADSNYYIAFCFLTVILPEVFLTKNWYKTPKFEIRTEIKNGTK